MKVRYIASACVVIEHNNVQVLCDPWLTEGIYYGSWYHYPPLEFKPNEFFGVDYVYISHIHPDHLDIETLKKFPLSTKILIHDYAVKSLLYILKGLGFQHVIEVPHRNKVSLSDDFSVEILAADDCNSDLYEEMFSCEVPKPYLKTLQIDSLAVFSGSGQVVVNANDCPYDLSHTVCDYIKNEYKEIDFLLVPYSGAGEYPQCFQNLDQGAKLQKAEQKKPNSFPWQFSTLIICVLDTLCHLLGNTFWVESW